MICRYCGAAVPMVDAYWNEYGVFCGTGCYARWLTEDEA